MHPEPTANVPAPRIPLHIRVACAVDVPFIDELQKAQTRNLGFFPRQQLEGYLGRGAILLAEGERGEPVGYCIFRDSYCGRDEVGAIYQLCVVGGRQRGLIGAALVRAAFERSAYGCRLFCCWCAQDLEANRFWEAIGFVPLAFRTGSRGRRRIHIFWQKRIRGGDTSTPWWFPWQTRSGAIREDRLVFPIPPGVHWSEAKPIILPGEAPVLEADDPRALARRGGGGGGGGEIVKAGSALARPRNVHAMSDRLRKLREKGTPAFPVTPPGKIAVLTGGRIRYLPKPGYVTPPRPPAQKRFRGSAPVESPEARKHHARQRAFVRELRDRWLEQVNSDETLLVPMGKYDIVAPELAGQQACPPALPAPAQRLLPAA